MAIPGRVLLAEVPGSSGKTIPQRRERRWLLAAAPCSAILLATCGVPSQTPAGPAGRVAVAQLRGINATITATGTVAPALQSRLNFRVGGTFVEYKMPVGSHVQAGQELARLDAPDQDAAEAAAEASLAKAQGALKAAQAKLELMQNAPRPETVAQAKASLATAQARLASEEAQGRAEDVASKQAALDAAKAKLDAMQQGPRPEDVAQAQATLDQARAKLQALRNGPRPEQTAIYQTQVEQAKNALLSAQLNRDATCGLGKGGLCDAANAQVNAAQNAVDLANQQSRLNTAPPTATDLTQAQAAVTAAEQALAKAKAPYTDQDLQQQKDAVTQAQEALKMAQQPYTPQDLAQAAADVQSAQAALALAQQPYLPQDIEQGQAAVDQAQATVQQNAAQLQSAKQDQSSESIRAPYDGVILSESANPGEAVGPNGVLPNVSTAAATGSGSLTGDPAIVMASEGGLQVTANVDQTDIDKVRVGQHVELTFDAFPNRTYTGKVTFVPPQGTSVQNVQQYVIFIAVDNDADLKPGMTANCIITISSKDGVLVVPSAAVQNVDGHSVVLLKGSDGATHEQPVQTGLSNPTTTEVVSGLHPGDTVVLGRVIPPGPGPAK